MFCMRLSYLTFYRLTSKHKMRKGIVKTENIVYTKSYILLLIRLAMMYTRLPMHVYRRVYVCIQNPSVILQNTKYILVYYKYSQTIMIFFFNLRYLTIWKDSKSFTIKNTLVDYIL